MRIVTQYGALYTSALTEVAVVPDGELQGLHDALFRGVVTNGVVHQANLRNLVVAELAAASHLDGLTELLKETLLERVGRDDLVACDLMRGNQNDHKMITKQTAVCDKLRTELGLAGGCFPVTRDFVLRDHRSYDRAFLHCPAHDRFDNRPRPR